MRGAGPAHLLVTAAAAGTATGAVLILHRAGRLPGGSDRWARTNHAGRPVTLVEGVAVAVGGALPLLLVDPPASGVVLGAALAGGVDDLVGDGGVKGLTGHLGALRRGRMTTGAGKVVALAASGAVGAAWSDRCSGRRPGPAMLAAAGLVAGGANLANLLDLRPGRALKVVLALAIPLALGSARGDGTGGAAAAAASGAALVALPGDLRGRTMLGDTGANPLGALVALAAAQRLGPRGRWLALAGVAALTLSSERVSFTRVIESTPVLRELDRWGRPR